MYAENEVVYARYIDGSIKYRQGIPDIGVKSSGQDDPYNKKIWMRLALDKEFPEIDYLRTEHFFTLASEKLLACLDSSNIPYEEFDVEIENQHLLSKIYKGIHLLPRKLDILDVERSEFTTHPWGSKRVILRLSPEERLVRCDKTLQLIVDDKFKVCCEKNGITGLAFFRPSDTPVGFYSPGIDQPVSKK